MASGASSDHVGEFSRSLQLLDRYLSDDDLRELAKLPTPFVLLDRYVEGIEERCVTFNHHHASRIAVEHLIAGGHQKIVLSTRVAEAGRAGKEGTGKSPVMFFDIGTIYLT